MKKKYLLYAVYLGFYSVVTLLIKSLVLMMVWDWFVVELLDLGYMNYLVAVGLTLGLTFTKTRVPESGSGHWKVLLEKFLVLTFVSVLVLVVGWVLHIFV